MSIYVEKIRPAKDTFIVMFKIKRNLTGQNHDKCFNLSKTTKSFMQVDFPLIFILHFEIKTTKHII